MSVFLIPFSLLIKKAITIKRIIISDLIKIKYYMLSIPKNNK